MKRINKAGKRFSIEKSLLLMGWGLFLCACTKEPVQFDSYLNKFKQRPQQSWPSSPFFTKMGLKPTPLLRDPFNVSFQKQPLFSLKQLAFKGLLKAENHSLALIQQPDEQIVVVQVGDKLGAEQAQVILIQEKFLQVQVDKTIKKINMD